MNEWNEWKAQKNFTNQFYIHLMLMIKYSEGIVGTSCSDIYVFLYCFYFSDDVH